MVTPPHDSVHMKHLKETPRAGYCQNNGMGDQNYMSEDDECLGEGEREGGGQAKVLELGRGHNDTISECTDVNALCI